MQEAVLRTMSLDAYLCREQGTGSGSGFQTAHPSGTGIVLQIRYIYRGYGPCGGLTSQVHDSLDAAHMLFASRRSLINPSCAHQEEVWVEAGAVVKAEEEVVEGGVVGA